MRPRKITIREMREARARNVLVCCQEITCAHSVAFNVDGLSDDLILSDLEPKLRCSVCGSKAIEVRPIYWTAEPVEAKPWPRG